MSYQYTYMGKVDVVFGLVHKSMFLTKLRSWSMNFTIMHSTLLHNPCNMFFLCIFRNDHINCTTYHMLKIFQHSLTYYSNWKWRSHTAPSQLPLLRAWLSYGHITQSPIAFGISDIKVTNGMMHFFMLKVYQRHHKCRI